MPLALLETKLFLPHARAGLVARPRLDDLMGRRSRLTLVSAPAGFGKTTLLATWLAEVAAEVAAEGRGTGLAWVSLDAADREAESFWSYVLTALDRAAPGTGSAGLALLGTGQPVESVLAAVLNELSVLPDDVVLVLDDYHLAESPAVQPGMTFLVERLPPQVRLVISTRADPALPLARLRARGDLTEVRAADLRFTDAETTAFLADATGLALAAADVAALGHRTEGWIASLQLAAISLRDRADPAQFIAGFTGDDRYVVDYLVEEVLNDEPAEVRDFLLSTSVLDRLTGPLCDAVTEATGGARMLESLERRNLFVVPLDDQRRWYRYHHLFADVLRARLHAEQPERVAELHRRASDWYAAADDPEAAVRHALAAGDPARAADVAELAAPELARNRREAVIRHWADEIPADVVANRPVLGIRLVGGLMSSNILDGVEARLTEIERQLELPEDQLVVLDPDELPRIPAAIEMYRAALALNSGDLAGTTVHADRVLEMTREDDHLARGAAAALSGLASWTTGGVDAALRSYTVSVAELERAGHIADVLGCSIAVSDLQLTLGRLEEAGQTFEGALDLARRHSPDAPLPGTADMLVGLSRVAWERNDLAGASEHLRHAEALGDDAALAQNPYRLRVALARLRVAEGDTGAAIALLDDAIAVYVGDYSPDVQPVAALRARVLAAHGRVTQALGWVRARGLTADDELSYLREYEHLTLARVLLAERRVPEAAALLGRLLTAAEEGERLGTVIEVEVLRAVACGAAGDHPSARSALGHAVDLAEPEGWVRVFVDAGSGVAAPLRDLAARRPGSAYLRELLAAGAPVAPPPVAGPAHQELVEPLSEREVEVLRLLGSELDGPAIARELVVSLNTVRTHTKHIYAKLGVNNRRAAVSRAHQLGLLSRAGRT